MVSHTPEPWRIEEGTTSIWGRCNSDDPSSYGMGYPIAEARITPSGSWAKGPWADEGEANAHRIVACVNALEGYNPEAVGDVVEALEAADSHFGPFVDITINGQHDPDDVRTVGLIRAALAKAKGGRS